ncbi:hypothetical protein PSEEN0967 [Pseudomonas entomophila L48]|uniref:Uncharacterized protein n=1 Tax=Pseudomonas entomophila (strain L48) TaxID=384676 RepID=Q1IEN3_PSEE4|nr:hypothetical protein PSEEN0967 [Pseudomonas entomophila L48]
MAPALRVIAAEAAPTEDRAWPYHARTETSNLFTLWQSDMTVRRMDPIRIPLKPAKHVPP